MFPLITNLLSDYKSALDTMINESVGAADVAFAKIEKSLPFRFDRELSKFKSSFEKIGHGILAFLTPVLEAINAGIKAAVSAFGETAMLLKFHDFLWALAITASELTNALREPINVMISGIQRVVEFYNNFPDWLKTWGILGAIIFGRKAIIAMTAGGVAYDLGIDTFKEAFDKAQEGEMGKLMPPSTTDIGSKIKEWWDRIKGDDEWDAKIAETRAGIDELLYIQGMIPQIKPSHPLVKQTPSFPKPEDIVVKPRDTIPNIKPLGAGFGLSPDELRATEKRSRQNIIDNADDESYFKSVDKAMKEAYGGMAQNLFNMSDTTDMTEQTIAVKQLESAYENLTRSLDPAIDKQIQLTEGRKILNQAFESGLIIDEKGLRDIGELTRFMGLLDDQISGFTEKMARAKQGFQSFWSPFLKGAKDASDLVDDLGNRIADKLLNSGLDALFDSLTGTLLGDAFGWLFGSAKGNVFQSGNLVPFAYGGIVDKPTVFPMADGRKGIMAERDKEAIMPLRRGRDGRLGVESVGGGGNISVNMGGIHIDASGADPAAVARLSQEVDKMQVDLPNTIVSTVSRARKNRVL